jgi:hypothetical protein
MIDMDFLVRKEQVAGLEFMNFQNDSFYVTLVSILKEHLSYATKVPVLQKTVQEPLLKVLKDYTGFENINVKFMEDNNLYMDTGYFSPGHVINIKGVEYWLDSTDTTIYRWFTQNKDKIFKGSVDYKTGKVAGSFCTIPLELGINVNVSEYFGVKETEKWKVTTEDLLAGGIVHEMGHAFSGCMMMATAFSDNIVAQASIAAYRNCKRDEDRVVVLKDSATLLGLKTPKADELIEFAKQANDESFLMYYTKMTAQRNNQRALSVGVAEMTSEVAADMYAIRMGCSKGIVAAVGVLTSRGVIASFMSNLLMSTMAGIWLAYAAALPPLLLGGVVSAPVLIGAMAIGFTLSFTLNYFAPSYSGVYNSDARRLEDAVRQLIAKLKECKGMPAPEKSKLSAEIGQLLKVLEQNRTWFDNTVIYRAMGWVFSGSDFKLREIEHYTQALNNNEMTVLAERLKGV